MGISCGCDYYEYDVRSVGQAKIVKCRTPRKCSDCGGPIEERDTMYVQAFYDFGSNRADKPRYICESCGDLIESLIEQGFCFSYGDVKGQWREYLFESGEILNEESAITQRK